VKLLERVREHLNNEEPVRSLPLSEHDREAIKPFRFLTSKAVLYAANIDESEISAGTGSRVEALTERARAEGNAVLPLCAKLEDEIAGLPAQEAQPFIEELGLGESGLQRLVRATRELLGLISFFTFNEQQTRSWTIAHGTRAQAAAGVIHTDFAERFIRAEVTAFDDFDRAAGEKGAREHGWTRTEGRDYIVQDADVIYFRIGS